MGQIIYPEESYKIIGACFNVYKTMGCGFLEAVYQECLEIEFEYQKIPYCTQKELEVAYRDRKLKQSYKVDFLCYEKIIVELCYFKCYRCTSGTSSQLSKCYENIIRTSGKLWTLSSIRI